MTVTAANTHDITQAAALIREDDMVAILYRNCRNLAQKRLIPRMGTELTRFNQRFHSSAKNLQHFIVLEVFGRSVIIGFQKTQIYQRFAGSRQEVFILRKQF